MEAGCTTLVDRVKPLTWALKSPWQRSHRTHQEYARVKTNPGTQSPRDESKRMSNPHVPPVCPGIIESEWVGRASVGLYPLSKASKPPHTVPDNTAYCSMGAAQGPTNRGRRSTGKMPKRASSNTEFLQSMGQKAGQSNELSSTSSSLPTRTPVPFPVKLLATHFFSQAEETWPLHD